VGSGALSGASAGAAIGPIGALGGAILGGVFGFMSGGGQVMSERAQLALANEQREYEKISLGLTASKAAQAATVGLRQLAVAESRPDGRGAAARGRQCSGTSPPFRTSRGCATGP
jgi:hypothetical protein